MPFTPDLRVGGLVPLSTIDWPGQLTATVFARGCPWRCPYCHNPHLLEGSSDGISPVDVGAETTWADVLAFLDTRRGLLDGVVFSGGEPTMQRGLPTAICDVCEAGFSVALHTSGSVPRRLAEVLPLTSWVGFDAKAPFDEYERITMIPGSGALARESLRVLVASGVPFEVRTTVQSDLLDLASLERLADDLAAEGVRAWVLQPCRTEGARPGLRHTHIAPDSLNSLRERIETVSVRQG